KQRRELGRAVDVRRPAAIGRAEQPRGRQLGASIEEHQIPGEAPYYVETSRPVSWIGVLWKTGPLHRDLDGEHAPAIELVRVTSEPEQLLALDLHLESELAAQREILLDPSHDGSTAGHDCTSGQGSATCA